MVVVMKRDHNVPIDVTIDVTMDGTPITDKERLQTAANQTPPVDPSFASDSPREFQDTVAFAADVTVQAKDGQETDVQVETINLEATLAKETATVDFKSGSIPEDLSIDRPNVRTQPKAGVTVRSGKANVTPPSKSEQSIGEYQVKKTLGRGGMGVVYLAHQPSLKRDVALKMILAGAHASRQQFDRFRSEARAVAQLQHPNIVQVYEVGDHEGLPYFSLEYVPGLSLDRKLDGKPLTPKEAAQITEKVCRAMQYAHDRGILHRDLKPANILLTETGEPKVSDFGLAKQLDDEGDSASTRTGTIVGTPSYMSPEQAQGLVHQLTASSDQYSIGAMLYELLTGRPPFLGSKAFDTISQVVNKEPVPPCELLEKLPRDIDTICLKALQKSSEKRYANCSEMADDLGRFLRGEPIIARPISLTERAWRWCRRNPFIALPTTAAALLLFLAAAISTWSYFQISAQAAAIAQERDNVEAQRKIAVEKGEIAQREKEEAERQRILANEAKIQAEKNQKLAEEQAMIALKNIQFVITDIDNRMAAEPGMTELRIGMLQLLEKRWNELDLALTGGVQGEAIPTLLAVRAKIADAWVSVDRLKEADAQYEALYQKAQERIIEKNRSDAARFNLAAICNKWAPIRQRLTADPATGDKLRQEANDLLRETLKDPRPAPGSPALYQITDVLQQSVLQSANAKLKQGDLENAKSMYQEVHSLNQKVVSEIRESAEWFKTLPPERQSLIQSYFEQNIDLAKAGQANILCRQGKAAEAIPIYDQIIAARRAQVQQQPKNRNARDQLAIQLRNFGQNMLRSGRVDDAVRLLGNAHDLNEQNFNEDPMNANFKRSFGYALYYWGVARAEAGQTKDALALFERSRFLRQELLDKSDDKVNQVNLMLSEARLGNQTATLKLIEALKTNEAKDPDLRLDIARAFTQLSVAEQDDEKKKALIGQALEALEQAITDGLADPFALTGEVDLAPLRTDGRFKRLAENLAS